MKINPITALMALAAAALMAYGFYTYSGNDNRMLIGIGSFMTLAGALLVLISINFNSFRMNTNMRMLSVLFFGAAFALNLVFAATKLSDDAYIISGGLLVLCYLFFLYSIKKAGQ